MGFILLITELFRWNAQTGTLGIEREKSDNLKDLSL